MSKKIELCDKEIRLTLSKLCEMLQVSPETHWIKVESEMTRDAPQFYIRIKAIRR